MADTGEHTEAIAAAPEQIIEVLLDFPSYPAWQRVVTECEVLDSDGEGRASRVRTKVDVRVARVEYVARYAYDLPHSMSWALEYGDLKDLRGRYTLRPREDGGTDVSVEISFEPGFFVPGPVRTLIRDQSLRTAMRELRKRVEG